MTPQDLRERRTLILDAMLLELSPSNVMTVTEGEEWLDKLDALDKEYAAAQKTQSPFYALLVALDNDYSLLKSAQGNPARLRAALEGIVSDCRAYEETLKGDV